jgi:N-acetyl-alpha-D-muramate 1-phosphate uridylyltransferase
VVDLAPVAILAGGRGTRLSSSSAQLPKALVEVAGEPFLFHQLRLLRRSGARRVVLCVGYRGDQIRSAVGDGATFDLEVGYSDDGEHLLGTASALRKALPKLGAEFHVLYGDTYLRVDYAAVEAAFRASGLPALMTVFRNLNAFDRSNARYANGRVVAYDKETPSRNMEWIDYGLAVLTPEALATPGADLADVYRDLAGRGLLAGYEANQRFFHVGNPEALRETDKFFRSSRSQGR